MKVKKYLIIPLLALNVLLVPAGNLVYAQTDLSQQIAQQSGYGPATGVTLSQTVGRIIRIVLSLLGTIFLVLTVYAGILWMTAGGEEAKIEKAKGIIKTSIIGLIIILAAYSITYFVVENLFKLTFAAPVVHAQEALEQLKAAGGASGAGLAGAGAPTDPRLIVANVIRIALGILGTIFLVLTVYAGFLWMTAGGEEEKIGKAKKLLYNGVIGLIIILSSYAIAYFVFQALLGATTGANPFGFGDGFTNYGPNPQDYEWYQ